MMRVKVERIGGGLHPSEVVVAVETRTGREELSVDGRSLQGSSQDSSLEIGWPVGQDEAYYLVELPNETFRGFWRVWVPKSDVTSAGGAARAVA
ncbi:hypothetical protein [Methylobacterium oryzisoli]|uniref:hypothetical protein n=1 Tax=Methylobacterium oryzisoli TaxID=3385502 RepID=UPI0038913F43